MRLIRSIETELNEQRSLVAFQTTEEMETARIDHRRICDAILANDAEEARESMMTHLEHTYDNIKKKQYYKNDSFFDKFKCWAIGQMDNIAQTSELINMISTLIKNAHLRKHTSLT